MSAHDDRSSLLLLHTDSVPCQQLSLPCGLPTETNRLQCVQTLQRADSARGTTDGSRLECRLRAQVAAEFVAITSTVNALVADVAGQLEQLDELHNAFLLLLSAGENYRVDTDC